jgi:hypothetical protein
MAVVRKLKLVAPNLAALVSNVNQIWSTLCVNIKQVNDIPIVEFLARQGFTPAKDRGRDVWYISPLRVPEKTPSFKVDTVLNDGPGLPDLSYDRY